MNKTNNAGYAISHIDTNEISPHTNEVTLLNFLSASTTQVQQNKQFKKLLDNILSADENYNYTQKSVILHLKFLRLLYCLSAIIKSGTSKMSCIGNASSAMH